MSPRLISLGEAIVYLGGKHPSKFGAAPARSGRDSVYDVKELDILLDLELRQRLAKRQIEVPVMQGAANDGGVDELEGLSRSIGVAEGV